MDHRGMVGRIYIEDHYTLLQTKYQNSGPCGFEEEDFLISCFFHCMSTGAICCHGNPSSYPTWPKTLCSDFFQHFGNGTSTVQLGKIA